MTVPDERELSTRKRKDTEIDVLKPAEGGVPVKDNCRALGISPATFYQWRSKYGGLEAADLKRLRDSRRRTGG